MRNMLSGIDQSLQLGSNSHFFNVAHGFFDQGGDPSGFVSRRGIHFFDRLSVKSEVFFTQFIAHLYDCETHLRRNRAFRNDMFTARKSVHFTDNDRTASIHDQVRHGTDRNVSGQRGRPVRTAALYAQHQA